MLSGSDLLLGKWNIKQGVWMTPHHEGEFLVWQALISVPDQFELDYKYALVDDRLNVIKWEAGGTRRLLLPEGLPDGAMVDVLDTWQDGSSPETLLSRNAFRKVIFGKGNEEGGDGDDDLEGASDVADLALTALPPLPQELFQKKDSIVLRFRVHCSRLDRWQKVCVTGSASGLGAWSPTGCVSMLHTQGTLWEIDVHMPREDFPIRYKYCLVSRDGSLTPEFGADMELGLDAAARKPAVIIFVADGHFRANPWRGAGVAIPVFSLRSSASVGVGEFSDLQLAVDVASRAGLRLLQLLPVNDTSVHGMWWDSYPYSSLSVFALHPLYLRLQELDEELPADIQAEIEQARIQLDKESVDYESTLSAKLRIARRVFNWGGDRWMEATEFKQFFKENQDWLKPYAAFCFLKSLFGTADHSQWGVMGEYRQEQVDRLVSPSTEYYSAIAFTYFIQFHLHRQLLSSASYAHSHRVVLKGDLPIGVDRCSVDTWRFKSLFHMDTSTGAPPDAFASTGQNWGFPTYNWEEMAKDDYAWWRARLKQMSKYFSAYRIDHVLGFFRIWELPDHAVCGILGHFRPSIPITAEELEQDGVWDFNRLCDPYVRCHVLQEKFGQRWAEIASKYFEEYQHLCYRFKSEFGTERKIVAAVQPREGSPDWLEEEAKETQKGLLDLFQNVVLIRLPSDARKFYPRIDCQKTSSFQELDEHTKCVLQRVYVDYFYHRQEQLWRSNALKTLPALMGASDMLACGEDLGMVPACVPPVLSELGLLGLRIQRMPTNLGQDFANPAEYEYMTVCAPSCHDTSTLRAWWEEDAERRQKFFRTALGFSSPAPDSCTPDVARAVIQQHCDSPSVWAIFPMQDLMALRDTYLTRPANEETINDPTNPRHYWRFRMHVRLEDLLSDSALITSLQQMLLASARTSPNDLPDESRDAAVEFLSKTVGSLSLSHTPEALGAAPPPTLALTLGAIP